MSSFEDLPDWVIPGTKLIRGSIVDGKSTTDQDSDMWDEIPAESFDLRGKFYLEDSQKFSSKESAFVTKGFHVLKSSAPFLNCGKNCPELASYLEKYNNKSNVSPQFFIVAWQLPGPPYYTAVHLLARRLPLGEDKIFDSLLENFAAGDNEFRDQRLKYICQMVKCPWLVRSALGALGGMRPVILGNKLDTHHFRGENYIEMCFDVSTSRIASSISGIVLGAPSGLIIDNCFVIQGNSEEELPERVLGGTRIIYCKVEANSIPMELPKYQPRPPPN